MSDSQPPIPRLHVITDESFQSRFSHIELAEIAAENGADAVQYREKRSRTMRELADVASSIVEVGHSRCVRVVINDRVDVCLAAHAGGVHLGSDDLEVSVARTTLGDGVVIGGTANSFDQALRVADTPVDYLGIGPVYGTRSKANPAPPLGLYELSRICRTVGKPVIAIGNIQPRNVSEVLDAGARGIAVLSGVILARDVALAMREYRAALDTWLGR